MLRYIVGSRPTTYLRSPYSRFRPFEVGFSFEAESAVALKLAVAAAAAKQHSFKFYEVKPNSFTSSLCCPLYYSFFPSEATSPFVIAPEDSLPSLLERNTPKT